jgi:hypothetical protein
LLEEQQNQLKALSHRLVVTQVYKLGEYF